MNARNSILWLLIFVFVGCGVGIGSATTIDDRLLNRIDGYVASPWPDPTIPTSNSWGMAGAALAYLYRAETLNSSYTLRANDYIQYLCNWEIPIPASGYDFEIYFKIPMINRMFLDAELSEHITAANLALMRRVMWQFIKHRSLVANAQLKTWYIQDSENHNMVQKSAFLLGAQALAPLGDGYDNDPDDHKSLASHEAAWEKFFFEHFRQVAREGLNVETASDGYAKYTLGSWYNVADLSNNTYLKAIASDAIDLFWADYAGDFVTATGLRGAAGSRCYKDSLYQGTDSLRAVLYGYDWHDTALTLHPFLLQIFESPYRPPAIVQAIAADPAKANYINTTRRFGKGGAADAYMKYTVTFEANNSSSIRRDTFWTPDYVMGGFSFKTDSDRYIAISDQNRIMGVFFAGDANDRIILHGKGDPAVDATKDFAGVSGILTTNCLVGAWDKNATDNVGTRIFMSDGSLMNNRAYDTGWIFTWTAGPYNNAFVGIKIATGGYTTTSVTGGMMIDFVTKASPVVIQMGSGADYTFATFKTACKAQTYTYASGLLTYYALGTNVKHEYWSNSGTLPQVADVDVAFNPSMTYNSPYLKGNHGEDDVTVKCAGYSDLNLDFNYINSPMWDDYQTVALWHMDALSTNSVVDDNLLNTSRDRHLQLYGNTSLTATAKFGSALRFGGTTSDYAQAVSNWPANATVKVDAWYRTDSSPSDQYIVNAASTFGLRIINGTGVRFTIWDTQGATPKAELLNNNFAINTWHHATATCDATGLITLNVDGVTTTGGSGYPMKNQSAVLRVGMATNNTAPYDGNIDDLKVRTYNLQ